PTALCSIPKLCHVSSQKAEEMSLSSGVGRWRSSGVCEAPGGSCISSSCALILRVAGEIDKSKIHYCCKNHQNTTERE
uniref:Uncharacterized protein n=1 Tax=Bubo bubo TaxID=30461 RepID=A0A8C0EDD1_BUBBB